MFVNHWVRAVVCLYKVAKHRRSHVTVFQALSGINWSFSPELYTDDAKRYMRLYWDNWVYGMLWIMLALALGWLAGGVEK